MCATTAFPVPLPVFGEPALQLEVEVLPLRGKLLAGSPQDNYLLLIVRSQAAGAAVSQVTLDLALLLDSSHSMLGGPFTQATEGALAVLGQLDRKDKLSILTFDEAVTEVLVRGTTQALPEVAQKLRRTVIAGGRTDIGGALDAAGGVLKAARGDVAAKVLMLTDGRPTAGLLEQDELVAIVETLRERGVSVSCIGLGVDYDEELLIALASAGGGYYYHSSRPRDIRKLFQREMAAFKNIHLRELELELRTPQGFRLAQVVNAESRRVGEGHRVRLPDLERGTELELLLQVQAEDHPPGWFKALDWRLRFQASGQEQRLDLAGYGVWQHTLDPEELKENAHHPRVERALTVKNIQSHLLSTIQGIKTQTISREQAYQELKSYQKTLVLQGRTIEAMEIQQAIHHLGQGQEEEAVKELGQSAFHLQRGARPEGEEPDAEQRSATPDL